MGLPISIHVRGADPGRPVVQRRVAAVFAELRHADAVFSPYRDDSDLSRWERGEVALADADPDLARVVALCAEAKQRTGGWFDPEGLPDPRTGSPRFDPSGLVKGWAVHRAARQLAALDGYGWCLNAGGDVAVHAPADQPPWRIGIEDPADPDRMLEVVHRRDGAVATSGTAHRGGHIVNPYTRRPATEVQSVTIVGPHLMWADVHATAAAARGTTALGDLDDLDGYEALFVTRSGRVLTTAGWTP